MNTVFEPAMMFISEVDWEVTDKRDAFLGHFLEHLRCIDELNITRIYWTNQLEEYLWNSPQSPPWRQDKDWRIPLVPIIYRLFLQSRILLDSLDCSDDCLIAPPIGPVVGRKEACQAFRQLLHHLLIQRQSAYLCLGLVNRLSAGTQLAFTCSCHDCQPCFTPLNDAEDWFTKASWIDTFWPRGTAESDVNRFRRAIAIASGWRPGRGHPVLRYEYEFEDRFIASLADEHKLRNKIVDSIASRLAMTQAEAGRDGGLKDESVKGREGVRRFRVTLAARIHYRYGSRRKFIFTDYYGEGGHDDGL